MNKGETIETTIVQPEDDMDLQFEKYMRVVVKELPSWGL